MARKQTSDKERVKQLKESVKTLTSLAGYYRVRHDKAWLSEARKRRDEAIETAQEEFKEAEEAHVEAQTRLPKTEQQLRITQKELKALTSGKKVQRLLKLKRQIAALQRLVEEMGE